MFEKKTTGTQISNFRTLRAKKIAEYFTDLRKEAYCLKDIANALQFDKSALEHFNEDFDQLLEQQPRILGLSKSREFQKWWKRNQAIYLTKPVIAVYKDSNFSLGHLLDEFHLHFLETDTRRSLFEKICTNRPLIAIALPSTVLLPKIGQLIWHLMLLGPGVQMINSYTQPVITPLAQTAVQKGSQDLAPIALSIQSWLTNREKLKEVSKDLHNLTDRLRNQNFKGMTNREIQIKWADFERNYYDLFLSYNQALPSHLRDGRNFFRDWMMVTPVWLATSLSTFSIQYWIHKKEIDLLDAKMQTQGKLLSREERLLRRTHLNEMNASEDRIAGTLASWKLFEFMFPEFPREPLNNKTKGDIRLSYRVFVKSMRFDLYVQQFASQMNLVLKDIDAEFLQEDQLTKTFENDRPMIHTTRGKPLAKYF